MEKLPFKRLYWIDILRGIAALNIVLWHWQHFFLPHDFDTMAVKPEIIRDNYPLYSYLRPFYGQGWRAVQLFFSISGFIFFLLYSKKIADRKISFSKYLFLRVSRLYPLHWLTLFVVIAAQVWIYNLEGHYFIYSDFSLVSFITNFTLTFNWYQSDFAFNGPSWSISVEMFLYLAFFCACFYKLSKWWYAIVFIAVGYFLRGTHLDQIGSGLMSFFMGGIVFYLYNWCIAHVPNKKNIVLSAALLLLALVFAIGWKYGLKKELPFYFFEFVLFPIIVFTVALAETSIGSGSLARRFSFIGDISFSSYLWHFPLQVLFAIAADLAGYDRSIFYAPSTLGVFYVVLITISLVSYHYFEFPVQNILRKKWDNYEASKKQVKSTIV